MINYILQYLDHKKFDKRVVRVYNSIPSYERYKKTMLSEWLNIGEAKMKGSKSAVKSALPLKSLQIREVFGDEVYVRFDTEEFRIAMYRNINIVVASFIEKYMSVARKERMKFFFNNKDTFILLIDAVSEDYYIENENEIEALIDYLNKDLKDKKNKNNSIKQRMEIELEFIKRQNEREILREWSR